MTDPSAQTFGLPPCLRIPIAAASIEAIRKYVGMILHTIPGHDGTMNAICVRPFDRASTKHPRVKLWASSEAARFEERLHPPKQVWVHVNYDGYRNAYIGFGMPPIPPGYVLDHIQNRKAIGRRGGSHPYLRLCPVSRSVNTSGGVNTGGEGMEKEFLKKLADLPQGMQDAAARAIGSQIVYADPMDITKMLDIPPGTGTLPGVRLTQALLYPS
jgi:hypothetical protein